MSTYLMHHGIKGQKWGVRRYQNEDGTLTEAGKARYGGQNEYSDSFGRRFLTGNNRISTFNLRKGGMRANRQALVNKFNRRAQEAEARGDTAKAEKNRAKAEAQAAANANRDAYDRHTSTGKMFAQNYLLTGIGGEMYRNARARGEGRARAFLEGSLGLTPIGYALRVSGEKKAYGAHTRLGVGGGEF